MPKIYKQRSQFDCHLCCIAMAAQRAPSSIFSRTIRDWIEIDKGSARRAATEVEKLMALAGFEKDKDYWAVYVGSQNAKGNVLQLLNGRRAIIQVSSINHRKAHHIVFWDGHKLHDPSTKQVYRWLEQLTSAEHIWIFNEVPNANA
jgi:ABC-type bacteriocin/lantibiotic exporter with double-glycine peptidase domain